MSLVEKAESYFQNINSMANRICADINETKSAYDEVWMTLGDKEQAQILNECIIKPEILLRYSLSNKQDSANVKEEAIVYAQKRIIDETCNFAYRDEHSGPFSFKTQSQMNLNLFGIEKNTDKDRKVDSSTAKIEQIKPKIEEVSHAITSPRYKTTTESTTGGIFNKLLRKSSVSPDAEQEFLVSPDTSTTSADTLPKTGLDFLDNW